MDNININLPGGTRYVHMLGINGISMSGLAEILLARGLRVSGSDLNASARTEALRGRGAAIYYGNAAEYIDASDPPDLLVYTAAAAADNPERARAAELGIECIDRAALLGLIMADHELSIGVAGTHGKTTTCAMASAILLADGRDPTINIGGEYAGIGGNSRIGGRELFLAEACEYTDTFLKLRPSIAVVTNIEYDHVDYFRDLAHMRDSFAKYCDRAGVAVVANADDANVEMIRAGFCGAAGAGDGGGDGGEAGGSCGRNWISFGIRSHGADFTASDVSFDDRDMGSFTLNIKDGGAARRLRLRVPGTYNVYNALAAAAAATAAGCSADAVVRGLEGFGGVKKRFEHKGTAAGFDIYDDYAHHPSEVRTALEAMKKFARGGRLICVFQPHTYTRTKAFLAEFGGAFAAADRVMLADIFPAREADPGDISSAMLAAEINRAGGRAAYYFGGFPEIAEIIMQTAKPGDLVVTMGAGLASQVADIILAQTRKNL